ncbi:phosphotransferase enzyme family protein [Bacteriovorax sp. BAL6_X]|uniref:phosphotransferase n=1 Tax=Bacteriovorax sp. BAL6_X TaxID=1201290 RepID=UPI000385BBEB|nr:phosphotransferase [Bacteriovorax sp. BAL6_X]EPZ50329.1 phosphotransferase enzyme family protein [Bacteriovorax sp. BAL6_X]
MNKELIIHKLKEAGFYNNESLLEKLSGDASSREYYRLTNTSQSFVICIESPNGQQSCDFNTVTNNILDNIKTPEIFFYDPEFSILVLEDIGSVSLKDFYQDSGLSKHIQAVEDIKKYQQMPLGFCMNRIFDREKIGFEFDLACNFFLNQYMGVTLDFKEKDIVKDVREFIIDYYEAHRDVVCHRDYHSNNLYVKDNVLFHIDYQDMRVGPKMYDLVSLVDDCYINFSEEEKKKLLLTYDEGFHEKYGHDYHIVQVQRTFKALGSFSYLKIDKNKDGYLQFIPTNLNKLISICEKSSIEVFRSFSDILKRGLND